MSEKKLRLLFYDMRTGHVEAYEFNLVRQGDRFRVFLPHKVYHRVVAHFGKGPYTTAFTLTHGHWMLHGYLKSERNAKVKVEFEEVE
jgi:hypothetical protein